MDPIKGGCFCGNIRYEIAQAEYPVANCHCSMCRKASGAPYVTWLIATKESFKYTQGSPAELQSSADGKRFFCDKCGTPVVCINESHPDIVDVTVGSLDQPEAFKPTMDVMEDTRLPWA